MGIACSAVYMRSIRKMAKKVVSKGKKKGCGGMTGNTAGIGGH